MIKNWLIHGDCHSDFTWMTNGCLNKYEPEETGIIILGDAGFDFWLNKNDDRKKKEVNARGYHIYWLRGNHEARPQDIKSYEKIFDKNVNGIVYYNPIYPYLHAFLDYGFYRIDGYNCYIIGGAYSVDKYYRLKSARLTEETNDPKKSGWFNNEQLTREEMDRATEQLYNFKDIGQHIDFILSHTCPYSWEPRDMFLSSIDQSTVDNTMEKWMDSWKDDFHNYIWCFGHFHADRLERPHVEQYYRDTEELKVIYDRWKKYDATGELDWWLNKSPNFYERS